MPALDAICTVGKELELAEDHDDRPRTLLRLGTTRCSSGDVVWMGGVSEMA